LGEGACAMAWAKSISAAVAFSIIATAPAAAAEMNRKERAVPAVARVAGPSLVPFTLTNSPPIENLVERLGWAKGEIARLRNSAGAAPREMRNRVLLAALTVVITDDIERSIAIGDIPNANEFRRLMEEKLPDAPWGLEMIARHGAGGGDFALGIMALHGILGLRDMKVACSLLSSAWEKGFRDSAYRLSGCVADKDPAREFSLLKAAADAGHAAAGEILGRRCLESAPQDTACALARISAAATAGRPSAKSLLGWMHAQGVGVTADLRRAQALYIEAAGAGDVSAKNNLGELYESGRGVAVDWPKAAEYYRAAAEAGFAPAQFNLGRMYAAGAGLPPDVEKARGWLRSALKGGIQPAQKILDWLDAQPVPVR
jgi:TPR repeat protein